MSFPIPIIEPFKTGYPSQTPIPSRRHPSIISLQNRQQKFHYCVRPSGCGLGGGTSGIIAVMWYQKAKKRKSRSVSVASAGVEKGKRSKL
jgi:hypothetical protein